MSAIAEPAVAELPVAELPVAPPIAWPDTDPSLLEEGRPALPDFPLQSLPPWWRAWVSETAHGTAAPVDYVMQALLASVAGVCGAGVLALDRNGFDRIGHRFVLSGERGPSDPLTLSPLPR